MNEFNPLVSIVIPVYNGSDYLNEAINSALAQTYKNIEILVINDGSNDNGETEKITLSYGEQIKYFYKDNGGTSTALNLGIKNMNGSYFSWLSHDDIYYPDKIKIQVDELRNMENKSTIIMSELDCINEDYQKLFETDFMEHMEQYPLRKDSYIYPIVFGKIQGCELLIPKICFDTVGLFDEKELVAQDFEYFYRVLARFPHKLIPKVLVTMRDRASGQGKIKKERGDIEYSKLYIKIIENLSENDILLLAKSRLELYIEMQAHFANRNFSIALKYINNKLLPNLQIFLSDLTGQRFNGYNLHIALREKNIESNQLVLDKKSKDINTYVYNFNSIDSLKNLLYQKIFIDSEIIHLQLIHNIFDLNYLPLISKLKPTIITLHDPFFLGGHCIHSYDCNKWKSQCYDCKYLEKEFTLNNDISALNFYIKKQAIQNSNISCIVASQWMKDKVENSPIWKNKKIYLLPFGIDQNVYKPGDSYKARKILKLPSDKMILFFRTSSWDVKGLDIIIESLNKLKYKDNIIIITVGEEDKKLLNCLKKQYKIYNYGWIDINNTLLINLYHACDIFLMPSRQETFGLMAIEAMSCGKMVLAIEEEGTVLPEIINSPSCGLAVKENEYKNELERLINNKKEIIERGGKCLEYAKIKYSKDRYINGIISIYSELLNNFKYENDEILLLYNQLKKYSNNKLIKNKNDKYENKYIKKIKRIIKKCLKLPARIIWKLIKIFKLKYLLKKTPLYSLFYKYKIAD